MRMRFAITRCLVSALVIVCSVEASIALRPETGYRAVPADYGIIYKEVTFQTSDSVTIRGWFFPAQDTVALANQFVGRLIPMPERLKAPPRPYKVGAEQPKPTIVVCDGDAGNMTFLILYAYHFCTSGFNVLTFDWRGFGNSEEWPIESDHLVYSEFLLDYEAAIDFVKARPETKPDRIGLFGFSTGAYMSFAVAVSRGDVAALVCRGMLTSFEDVLPILAKLSPERSLHIPADFPTQLLPAHAAEGMKIPTLLVVGEDDNRTPPWMSRYVHERLSGPKELWIVSGAGHGGATAPEYVGYPEFFRRVSSFFARHLATESQ